MEIIEDYCKVMDYRYGVAKEPWKQVVNFKLNGIGIGYGILLGQQGLILTSKNIGDLVAPSSQHFEDVLATDREDKQFTLDDTFYRFGSGLGIVKTKYPVEGAARIGLDSSFYNHIIEHLPIVPGDKELNDLFWYGYHSIGSEIVSNMKEVDTLFHTYTFDFPYFESTGKVILYADTEKMVGYVHQQGQRLFPITALGPLEEAPNVIFKGPFFTGLVLNESHIGSPVFVRDTVDYETAYDAPESQQQPKLYLVGIVDKGAILKKNINKGYVTPVCQVVRAGSREIKELLHPSHTK